MKITDMTLQKLPTPETGAKLYADEAVPHFAIKVTQNGAKSFILTVGRERQQITIGRYPQIGLQAVRSRARQILAERELGVVHTPVRPSALSFPNISAAAATRFATALSKQMATCSSACSP